MDMLLDIGITNTMNMASRPSSIAIVNTTPMINLVDTKYGEYVYYPPHVSRITVKYIHVRNTHSVIRTRRKESDQYVNSMKTQDHTCK
jgi:hypothetical protein